MTTNSQQQNLIDDLKAPIKSFRIFALEEAIRSGKTPEVLAALEEIRLTEDDGECLMLVEHAINAVKERLLGDSAPHAEIPKQQQKFLTAWENSDDTQKMRVLSEMPARIPKDLRGLGPRLLEKEKSSVLCARLIRVFCRGWPKEEFSAITDCIRSDSLTLKLAALKTTVHMKPELLLEDLPQLLNSKDPQIKALAIRGLAKIDKEEALNHLQALLLSPEISDRLAGIQNCLFLPFDMVKPVLLKYCAAENHPELLIRAGWILEMNPDVQVPFKLFEIAERSPAKKSELVKKILNEAVKLLEKSGILGDQFTAYTRKLQAWVYRRNALRLAKQVVARLDEETISQELDQTLRNSLKQPVIVEAFQEALNWPISETAKSRLLAYMKSSVAEAAEKLELSQAPEDHAADTHEQKIKTTPVVDADADASRESEPSEPSKTIADTRKLSELSRSEQIKAFAGLSAEEYPEHESCFRLIVGSRDYDAETKTAAFNCLTRLKIGGYEDVSVKILNNPNVALATAAVQYLGQVDPEAIFPYLGHCLNVADVRMKSAALGILKNFDFNQALSSLNAMLNSYDPQQQRMALECMDQFDFGLIRDQLTEYLQRADDEKLVEYGLCHFAANPSSDNAYSLYKIEQAHAGSLAEKIKKLRKACGGTEADAAGVGAVPGAQADESELKERLAKEKEQKKKQRPAYAYKSPAEHEKLGVIETFSALGKMFKALASSKGSWIALLISIVLGSGIYILFVPSSQAEKSATGSAIVADKHVREGTVTEVSGRAIEFKSTEGEVFILHPGSDGYRIPSKGLRLRVSLVPYRQTPDKRFLARIRAMRQIDDFSDKVD